MALYRFGDRRPRVGKSSWISDSARVIGDVVIGDGCYVGHGAVLRGDYGSIRLGFGVAVEENAVVHIRPEGLSRLGDKVTIGHGAIVHASRVADYAVIGMGAVLGFDVEIGTWSIIAEGCVVPAGTRIPDEKIAKGVPARIVSGVESRHKNFWTYGKQLYIDLAARYPKDFERIG